MKFEEALEKLEQSKGKCSQATIEGERSIWILGRRQHENRTFYEGMIFSENAYLDGLFDNSYIEEELKRDDWSVW